MFPNFSLHKWASRASAFALFISAALFSPAFGQQPEYRGIWVNSWVGGIHNAAEIDQLVADAQRGNLNAIFAQVRRRGDAFYDSSYEPRRNASFDSLAYLIQKAHAANPPIEVHAWIIAYPLGTGSNQSDHILNKHPDWLMQSNTGGTLVPANPNDEYWADPAHPEVQAHTFNVAMDIVRNYNIDGLHFDYIRYPSRPWGYNPVSVERFNRRHGRSGLPDPNDAAWLQFRRDAVTELVRRVYLEAIDLKPDLKISAATITQGGAPSQWTGSNAYAHRLQDWRAWMDEGILDLNVPMTYYNWQAANHRTWWNGWINFVKNHKYDRHLAIGPAWYMNTIPDSLAQIEETRDLTTAGNRAEGIVGYHYAQTNNQGLGRSTFLNALAAPNGPFPQKVPTPDMPWKSSPTRGHVKGIVTADNTGQPLEHAVVTLNGPQNRTLRTDAWGFYGAVDLLPGTYTLTASVPNSPYNTASTEITVVVGQVTTTDIALEFEALDEIIIDNPDAEFTGSWSTATTTNNTHFGDDYARNFLVSPATATYRPFFSIPGRYDVYVWYVSGSNRADNALHIVSHSGGQENIRVDQTSGGGQWQLLASDKHFASGTDGYVRISNDNASGDVIIADAVRFTLIEADPDPADFFEDPIVYAGAQSAIITWETVGPATVRAEYGLSGGATAFSPETTVVTTEHSVSISSLDTESHYLLRLHANADGEDYASNWFSFETGTLVEVIVDNLDPEATFSPASAWSTASFGTTYYGENYHRVLDHIAAGPTATYRPNLPVSGVYDLYTWYPSAAIYSYDVPHLIEHADGEDTVLVDQRSNGGAWRELITGKRFDAGTSGSIRLTHPRTGHTIADAMRWVLRDPPPEHTLTTSVAGSGSIGRSPNASSYTHGATVELTAIPASGWAFSRWEGDVGGNEESATITLYRDRQVTAVFHQFFPLSVETVGEGTIQLSPDHPAYPADTEVAVLAIPAEGWTFLGWSGDHSGEENPAIVWMDRSVTLIANFGFSYGAWAETTFTPDELNNPELSGPAADPFGHGIPNRLKYAFGIDLHNPDRSALPTVTVVDSRLRLTFNRLRSQADIQYRLESSTDLIAWDEAAGEFTEVSVEENPDGRTERVTVESNEALTDGRRFLRLRVEPL